MMSAFECRWARSAATLGQPDVAAAGRARFRHVVRGLRAGVRNIKNLLIAMGTKAEFRNFRLREPKGGWFLRARRYLLPLEGPDLSGLVFPDYFQILLPVALSNDDCEIQPGRVP
jgi:hypothetical protein